MHLGVNRTGVVGVARAASCAKWPQQKIEFWSGSTKLSEVTLVKDTGNYFSVPLRGLPLKDGDPLILKLKLPLAKSLKDLQLSADARILAVTLISARFE